MLIIKHNAPRKLLDSFKYYISDMAYIRYNEETKTLYVKPLEEYLQLFQEKKYILKEEEYIIID